MIMRARAARSALPVGPWGNVAATWMSSGSSYRSILSAAPAQPVGPKRDAGPRHEHHMDRLAQTLISDARAQRADAVVVAAEHVLDLHRRRSCDRRAR